MGRPKITARDLPPAVYGDPSALFYMVGFLHQGLKRGEAVTPRIWNEAMDALQEHLDRTAAVQAERYVQLEGQTTIEDVT